MGAWTGFRPGLDVTYWRGENCRALSGNQTLECMLSYLLKYTERNRQSTGRAGINHKPSAVPKIFILLPCSAVMGLL